MSKPGWFIALQASHFFLLRGTGNAVFSSSVAPVIG
jgi:hypothetical protein